MSTSIQQFYEPINVFRQNALHIKKRNSDLKTPTLFRTWQNDIKQINNLNQNIRKVSNDLNDQRNYYFSDKLRSDYFSLSDICSVQKHGKVSDISVDNDNKLIIAKNNIVQFFDLKSDHYSSDNNIHLQPLQQITAPCEPITKISFLNNNINDTQSEDLILTGHLDGEVNYISTTKEHSKIIRKFNHKKYIKHSLNNPQVIQAAPIKHLTPYSSNCFLSSIGDLIYIYDLDRKKAPLYLSEFQNLQSLGKYGDNILLSSDNCLKLLDIRTKNDPVVLYDAFLDRNTINCFETLNNTNHIAIGTGDDIKVIDIRYNNKAISQCLETGSVKTLNHDAFNNKLFCLNNLGTLSSWDLRFEATLRGFKHGFNNATFQQNEKDQGPITQCGDILVTEGDITAIEKWKQESIITLGFNEIGLHRMIKQKTILHSGISSTSIGTSHSEEAKYSSTVIEDSDDSATTLHESTLSSSEYDNDNRSWLSQNEITPCNSLIM